MSTRPLKTAPLVFTALACLSASACITELDPGAAMGLLLDDESEDDGALSTTCAAGATVKGIDVSVYQGDIDWQAVKNDGVRFAFIRVSDGLDYEDELFAQNYAGAKSAGVRRGAYQFFRPSQDATAQADLLVDAIGTLEDGDLPPVLDLESMGGLPAATVRARAETWLARVEARLGVRPIIYTGAYFWRDEVGAPSFGANHPLWIAHYTSGCALTPSPWSSWTFHQYTDSGAVAGIAGPVDMNRFNGSESALAALAYSSSSSSCSEEEPAVGAACASGCVWSSWAVQNGVQSASESCGGTPCACVKSGEAQTLCAVDTCDADDAPSYALTVVSPASGAVVENPVTFTFAGQGLRTVKVIADQWEILSFHPDEDGWTHTYTFSVTGMARNIRVRGFSPEGLPVVEKTLTITPMSPAPGGTTPTSHLTTRVGRATTILTHHEQQHLTLWNQTFGRFDGADPRANIVDTKDGKAAKRSCYGTAPCGTVFLNVDMLAAMQDLREQYGYQYFVTSIAGASHSYGSLHYQGRAFDIDEINGVRVNGTSALTNAFMNACWELGAVEVFGPSNDPAGHFDHIHCAF